MTACESPAAADVAGSPPGTASAEPVGATEVPGAVAAVEGEGKEPQASSTAEAVAEEQVCRPAHPSPGPSAEPTPVEAERAPQDVAVSAGKEVEVIGTQMNGSTGVVVEFLAGKDRWKVQFASGVTKNFKAENLRVAKPVASQKRTKKRPQRESGGNEEQVESKAEAARLRPVEGRGGLQVGGSVSDLLARIRAGSGFEAAEAEPPLQRRAEAAPPAAPSAAEPPAAAKEPAAAAQAPAAGEAPEPKGPMNLAGRSFAEKDDLIKHVREMQKRLDDKGGDGVLEAEDRFLLFHMVMQNPRTAEKIKAPVCAIRYGVHHLFPQNKCFILVFNDGTEEPVSFMKCVKELFALGPAHGKRARGAEADRGDGKAPKKRQRTASPEPARAAERSRSETGLQLIREVAAAQKHPLAAKWEYPLMDEEYRCFVGLMRCPVEPETLKGFYERVASGTTWGQPIDPRSSEPIPRKTAWMTSPGIKCTYRYGGVDVEPQEFPDWMLDLMQVYMPICGLSSREEWPNSCNLNLYEDGGMSVGWHSDDEKLFEGRYRDIRIISVSLGQARTFELREIGIEDGADGRVKYKMRLGDGDLCTMEGLTQKHYQHRVPKEEASGPRINLTWRWITRPSQPAGHR